MNEGQGQSGQLERSSLSIVISKYQDNTLKNKEVIQKIAKQAKIQVFDLDFQGH